ncbi:MAG: hypothetical protein ACE5E1_08120 [Phycisphaerae bacterium]
MTARDGRNMKRFRVAWHFDVRASFAWKQRTAMPETNASSADPQRRDDSTHDRYK